MIYARPHPPPLSRTPGLLAYLLWRCTGRHDRDPPWHSTRRGSLGNTGDGTAAMFAQARADFEVAWRAFQSKRTESDFQA